MLRKANSFHKYMLLWALTVISAVLVFGSSASFANMLMTPYLQAVSTSSIYVLVECDTSDIATVEYGTTTIMGSFAVTESTESTTNSTYVHNVKLTGLFPAARNGNMPGIGVAQRRRRALWDGALIPYTGQVPLKPSPFY